ncbi:uncharacterized protein LOC135470418 [Liolophura sinensis]|uniref:uncharacterized protein LOC135470418 n=1 Tax=Liolophura sinensis TaxID=3198878 RepID=UPI0031593AB3
MQAVIENSSVESFASRYNPKDNITMGQQHRPTFRKRSLAELPGNVRVPSFKKPDRLKSRLEASLAGLRELQTLREKHQVMVTQAKISFQSPLENLSDDSTNDTAKEDAETGNPGNCLDGNSTHSLSKIWKDTFGEGSLCKGTEESSSDTAVLSEAASTDTQGGVSVGIANASCGEQVAGVPSEKTENAVINNSNLEITDTKETCNEDSADTDPLKDVPVNPLCKIVSRPRSMSMSHFPRKRQEVNDKDFAKTSRSSADDILSANSATNSARLRRKESIFEGVDISVEGPNPVHAILMQYSLLSSTQSMPSVCSTLPRRHSNSPCKPPSRVQSESDTSSSKDSVFSQTDTITSSTQTQDITESKETENVATQSDGTSNSPSDKTAPDSHRHTKREDSAECRITRTLSHSHVGHSDSFRRSVPFKSHSMLRFPDTKSTKDSDNSKAREDKQAKEEKGVLEQPKSEENVYETIRSYSFSDNLLSSSSSRKKDHIHSAKGNVECKNIPRSTPQRPTLPSRARVGHSLANIRDRSFSASRTLSPNTMSQSSTGLSSRRSTLPKENSMSSFGSTGMLSRVNSVTSSKRSVPDGANSGKKIRRFGVPLDSKLIQNLLTRRDKSKPVVSHNCDTRSKEPNVAENNCMKPNSTKENAYLSFKSCSLDLSNDEYGMARLLESGDRPGLPEAKTVLDEVDDEYGMSILLDSSKTLTSTPLMAKRERGRVSSLTKHSLGSDEGYCPSQGSNTPASRRRRPHKISIRSDHTWISTDMEESDITHHSSQISPYAVSSPTNTMFGFKGFPANRHAGGSDSSGANSSHGRISPEWDMRSRRSSSVSFLSLSTDVPESSL